MTPINALLAAQHQADLHRAAARRRSLEPAPEREMAVPSTLAVRLAADDEAGVIRDLARLDDAPSLQGPILLALSDGEPVAALSLVDYRVVANPFVLTAEAVALLRVRARHLTGLSHGRSRRRTSFIRLVFPALPFAHNER